MKRAKTDIIVERSFISFRFIIYTGISWRCNGAAMQRRCSLSKLHCICPLTLWSAIPVIMD